MSDDTPDPASAPATLPKPGWYEESGRVRWWDGAAWTNEYAGEPVKPASAQPAEQAPVATVPVKPKRRVPFALFVTATVATLILGVIIGAASASGGRGEAVDAFNEVKDSLAAAEGRADTLQERLDDLGDRQAELDSLAAELAAREAAVTTTEQTIAANTIPGDGLFIVGADVQPGTYKSDGGSPCYWARLNATGDDIIDNYLGDGQTVMTVQGGDGLIETSGCAPFTKVG